MPDCQHERTEFLYRRDGIDYVRCLDCDQVFEAEDLDTVPVYDDEEEVQQPKRPQPHHHRR
jgi:Zn ribbon nucleic-acid-binding protein